MNTDTSWPLFTPFAEESIILSCPDTELSPKCIADNVIIMSPCWTISLHAYKTGGSGWQLLAVFALAYFTCPPLSSFEQSLISVSPNQSSTQLPSISSRWLHQFNNAKEDHNAQKALQYSLKGIQCLLDVCPTNHQRRHSQRHRQHPATQTPHHIQQNWS